MSRHSPTAGPVADARGGLRLLVDGTRHVTGLVEALHGQIQRLAPPLRRRDWLDADLRGPAAQDDLPPTRGITGLVYRSIQGTTRLVGDGLDGLLAPFDQDLGPTSPASPRRDALVGALNGVLGDHLLRSGNPLALPFRLRQGGQVLDPATLGPQAPARVLLLVHGLCMSDLGWCRNGHDHGQALAPALGAAPVYAFYNSGLHISHNGLALSRALQTLVDRWPVPLQRLDIVGHSMGGLVARSALHYATQSQQPWVPRLDDLFFLGTPHHGAPLERAGHWVDLVLGATPYAAPFARLGKVRSAGITDLRHGHLLDEDWVGRDRFARGGDHRQPVPLPEGLRCYALAASLGAQGGALKERLLGDGLVPLDSALGVHKDPARALDFPPERQWVGYGMNHLDLLGRPEVYAQLKEWLA